MKIKVTEIRTRILDMEDFPDPAVPENKNTVEELLREIEVEAIEDSDFFNGVGCEGAVTAEILK